MFKSKRRNYKGGYYEKTDKGYDVGCEWAKDDTLDKEFEKLPEDCDFYVVKHWLLKCGGTPCIELIIDREGVKEYIDKHPKAGDALEVWACTDTEMKYFYAKMPDEDGLIPVKGCAY